MDVKIVRKRVIMQIIDGMKNGLNWETLKIVKRYSIGLVVQMYRNGKNTDQLAMVSLPKTE